MGTDAQPIFIRNPDGTCRARFAGWLRTAPSRPRVRGDAPDDRNREVSALVRFADREPVLGAKAYSVLAPCCVVADALTKVVAQAGGTAAPYLEKLGASMLVTPPHVAAV